MTSLRTRLVAGAVAVVAVVLVASGITVAMLARAAIADELDASILARARGLAAQVEIDDGKLQDEIDPRSFASDEAVCVWHDRDVVGCTSTTLPTGGDGELQTIELAGVSMRAVSIAFEPRVEPGEHAAATLPRLTMTFARGIAPLEASARRITYVVVAVTAIGIVLCIALLLAVVRVGLRPVRELATAIESVRDVSSAHAPIVTTTAELMPIASRLDAMLARLSVAFERERELTAEVAHELRTPLAGLRVILDVALDRERTSDRYRAALVECLAITRTTEDVVETLLELAKLDAGQAKPSALPVEVDQLVRDVLATANARAVERGLDVTTSLEPVTRNTDRDKVRAVVANLVDNAITYADRGGTIRIELASDRLVVANTGCTLAPELAAKVFERFWRGDDARTQVGHAGLGLPLCKKLVELLGGSISVAIVDEQFIATVVLP